MAKAALTYRYSGFDLAMIDREARTIPISFSSEYPALQRCDKAVPIAIARAAGLKEGEIYIEVLDHDPASADLSMLNNRGAFLDEHEENQQLGVVEKAEISSDKMGRAVIRMGSDAEAVKRFQQMADNIRPHVSHGYKYTRFIREDTLPDGRKAKRFAWKTMEISSVAIPADPTVGVARDYKDLPQVDSKPPVIGGSATIDEILNSLTPEQKQAMKRSLLLDAAATTTGAGGGGAATATDPNADKIVREACDKSEKLERTRAKEIIKSLDELVKDHGDKNEGQLAQQLRTLAQECLFGDNPVSIGEFQTRAMKEVIKAKPAKPVLMVDCASPDDAKRYSILRGIQSAIKRREQGKDAIPDGLEGEVHQQMLRSAAQNGGLGYEPAGFQVPHDANLRVSSLSRRDREGLMKRDMQATVFNAGGAFVPTQLIVPIIELLRNRLILEAAGIRTMAGLQGNIVIPRQEAAATAYSVSEIGAIQGSQQILGQIGMQPRRVGAMQAYSKQFVMQSTPDAEAFMRDDLFKVIALAWDRLGIAGQGAANEPLGILNTPGISSIVFGATPTYIKIVSMETAITAANVTDELTYLSTPTVRGALKTVAEALTGATTIGGSQNALWKGQGGQDGMMNGYRALASNQIPGNLVLLGAFNQAIMGLWGGFDVVVDYFSKKQNAEVEIAINTWGDFCLRHPQAFCVSADAGNQ